MISKLRYLTTIAAAAAFAVYFGSADMAFAQDAGGAAPAADNAAPAADAAAPAEASAEEATAEGENAVAADNAVKEYGLNELWNEGDIVAKTTLIIMVIMSAGTWYLAVAMYLQQRKIYAQAATAKKHFWNAGSVKDGIAKLEKDSAFRAIATDGLNAASHHEGGLTQAIDLHEWTTMALHRSVESVASYLSSGLPFLATVGSTAPFVGLFGTVWGIQKALVTIAKAGQASIDKIAGPVGEALIMTAIGLAVAVPAVLFYNYLIRRNKVAMEDVRNFSADLHALLISGKK